MSSISSTGSLAALNSSGIQFSGLATGLDTDQLIKGLTALEQAKVNRLTINQQKIAQQQSAFKSVEVKLLDLQLESNGLARTFGNVLDARTASVSNQDAASVSASSSAATGVYQFHVNALAQAQQLSSQGYASATSAIGTGTLQIKVGSAAATTITIDAQNATLQGLTAAINNSGAGVTAAIVNDGSGAEPYRLLLTSKTSGAANTINLTNNLTGGSGAPPDLTRVVQSAADASITLGSGPGALTITSASNQIEGAFQGVVLNLKSAGSDVTLTVSNDTAATTKAVQGFVDSFNGLMDLIATHTGYDPKTKQAGLLLGNSVVNEIQNTLTRAFTGVVPGVNNRANTLAAVGITLNDQGKLVVNGAKLNQALNGQLTGVTTADVRRLFGLDGVSTNSGVQFVSAGSQTLTNGNSVAVNLTNLATQAAATAGAPLDAAPDIDDQHNQLTLKIDGKTSAALALTVKTYSTRQELVQELQGKINADSVLKGLGVVVGLNAEYKLTITSGSYGSTSRVEFDGGTALDRLGFTGSESGVGQDVAGSFGSEAATGAGQFLTGNAGNTTTDGLKVQVGLTELPINPAAQVTLTRGLASLLNQTVQRYLDPQNGRLRGADRALQSTYDDIQKSIDRQNVNLQARQQQLIKQFAALEGIVSKLKNTGTYLSGQLNSLKSLR